MLVSTVGLSYVTDAHFAVTSDGTVDHGDERREIRAVKKLVGSFTVCNMQLGSTVAVTRPARAHCSPTRISCTFHTMQKHEGILVPAVVKAIGLRSGSGSQ